ncbi:MAG TPA: Calx-beta domain-containing protein, partial [Pyrinomonadaceae bacterium]|nr:Calx-beta domain-containing protein [Pyrinomonadaceae bacterium]
MFAILVITLLLPPLAGAGAAGSKIQSKLKTTRASLSPVPVQPFQSPITTFTQVINLPTNDLVFNSQTQKLHVSVPGSAGANGNTITDIDPFAGTLGQSVLVGSEPNKLALSTDGNILYAGLDGAATIRRFDVNSHTALEQFGIAPAGSPSTSIAGDLAVAPGNSDLIAVTRIPLQGSPANPGVVVFDHGVQRSSAAFAAANTALAFSASETTLFGSGPFSALQVFNIDSSGVTLSSTTSFSLGGDIQFQNGLIYASNGKVVNPTTNTLVGTFSGVSSGPFVVDSAAGRAYYMIGNSTNQDQTVTLRAFDINTFAAVGETTISDVDGTATSLVRWGPNGLAFRTSGNQVFLIQTSLIPSQTPVPSPTPTPSPTPPPPPNEVSVRKVQLTTNDLIYNSSNQTIYCSVPSSVGSSGNSITPINPTTASLGTPVFVGSEPNKLALSGNNQKLYVGIDGAASVRLVDVATQTPGLQFFLQGGDVFSGPAKAGELEVLPGTSDSVAVFKTNGSSNAVAIYDNGVRRQKEGSAVDIEFGASAARLYGGNLFGNAFTRFNVDNSGVTFDSFASFGNGGKLLFANGLMYTANGSVFDPETGALKGTFTATAPDLRSNSIMTVDTTLGRAYFLTNTGGANSTLRVFDINTFQLIGLAIIQNVPGFFSGARLVRWGENGLAWRLANQVVLIQSTLVNPSGAVPAPTPTPSPTPVPSPTPQAATFVRTIDLPINDVVYQSSSQTIYASVGSSGGQLGNSITPINPTTGALGTSVFIGSEPSRLALSDDGQVLYAGLEGAGAIRRFDLASQTAGLQFSMGQDPLFGGLFKANDIAVLPGSHDSIAVARHITASPPEAGVAIYDNGVIRPTTTPGHLVASSFLAFSNSASTLYGGGFDSGLNTMTINSSGVTITSSTPFVVGSYIEFKNNLVYSSRGQVVDPATGALIGTFSNLPNFFAATMTVDTALGKIFFVSDSGGALTIAAYDINTFLPIGQITLPLRGSPTRILRWGANGLAIRAIDTTTFPGTSKLYLIQSALVSAAAPLPTGIQLNVSNPTVFENGVRFDVPVLRTGDVSGTSTINYSTSDGTATEKSDYITALGTLRFAPGESLKTVSLFITNDVFQEGNETFNFTLSSPGGAELVSPDKVTVTIQDDDFSAPTTNPIDGTTFFVRQQYRDFLNRDPDASGFQFWSTEINSCGADQQCRDVKRINVSAAFFLSIEFQETGYLAYRMYKVSYGDTTSPNTPGTVPIVRLREFLNDAQRIGRDVQVLVGDWQAKLEANKTDYAREFVAT